MARDWVMLLSIDRAQGEKQKNTAKPPGSTRHRVAPCWRNILGWICACGLHHVLQTGQVPTAVPVPYHPVKMLKTNISIGFSSFLEFLGWWVSARYQNVASQHCIRNLKAAVNATVALHSLGHDTAAPQDFGMGVSTSQPFQWRSLRPIVFMAVFNARMPHSQQRVAFSHRSSFAPGAFCQPAWAEVSIVSLRVITAVWVEVWSHFRIWMDNAWSHESWCALLHDVASVVRREVEFDGIADLHVGDRTLHDLLLAATSLELKVQWW